MRTIAMAAGDCTFTMSARPLGRIFNTMLLLTFTFLCSQEALTAEGVRIHAAFRARAESTRPVRPVVLPEQDPAAAQLQVHDVTEEEEEPHASEVLRFPDDAAEEATVDPGSSSTVAAVGEEDPPPACQNADLSRRFSKGSSGGDSMAVEMDPEEETCSVCLGTDPPFVYGPYDCDHKFCQDCRFSEQFLMPVMRRCPECRALPLNVRLVQERIDELRSDRFWKKFNETERQRNQTRFCGSFRHKKNTTAAGSPARTSGGRRTSSAGQSRDNKTVLSTSMASWMCRLARARSAASSSSPARNSHAASSYRTAASSSAFVQPGQPVRLRRENSKASSSAASGATSSTRATVIGSPTGPVTLSDDTEESDQIAHGNERSGDEENPDFTFPGEQPVEEQDDFSRHNPECCPDAKSAARLDDVGDESDEETGRAGAKGTFCGFCVPMNSSGCSPTQEKELPRAEYKTSALLQEPHSQKVVKEAAEFAHEMFNHIACPLFWHPGKHEKDPNWTLYCACFLHPKAPAARGVQKVLRQKKPADEDAQSRNTSPNRNIKRRGSWRKALCWGSSEVKQNKGELDRDCEAENDYERMKQEQDSAIDDLVVQLAGLRLCLPNNAHGHGFDKTVTIRRPAASASDGKARRSFEIVLDSLERGGCVIDHEERRCHFFSRDTDTTVGPPKPSRNVLCRGYQIACPRPSLTRVRESVVATNFCRCWCRRRAGNAASRSGNAQPRSSSSETTGDHIDQDVKNQLRLALEAFVAAEKNGTASGNVCSAVSSSREEHSRTSATEQPLLSDPERQAVVGASTQSRRPIDEELLSKLLGSIVSDYLCADRVRAAAAVTCLVGCSLGALSMADSGSAAQALLLLLSPSVMLTVCSVDSCFFHRQQRRVADLVFDSLPQKKGCVNIDK
ncbi:unnamed protein product [Amoebophrya sp. A120]|nr:unnamed protein product [Amoebophrya sp. A120]|eukprot:GSA120T00005679001.1